MKTILIVDANKASLIMTTEIFKDHYPGIKVLIAQTSKEALYIIQNDKKIDVIVIDFDLPDCNGIQTALKIKQFLKKTIIITAFETQNFLLNFSTLSKQQKEHQIFLKKPLYSHVVYAICDSLFYGNTYPQECIDTKLNALVRCTENREQTKSSNNRLNNITQEIHSSFPIIVEKCMLNAVQFKINYEKVLTNINFFLLKNLRSDENRRVILNFPDPSLIELESNSDYVQCNGKLKTDVFFNAFPFEMHGKIIELSENDIPLHNKKNVNNIKIDLLSQSFWVEFENAVLARKIFEAIAHKKMNEQLSDNHNLWY